MKKVVWFSFVCALLILGAMVFDYLYNDRFHRVQFHTVSMQDVQNISQFSAPLTREDGFCFMTGAVRLGDNITVGADVVVTVDNQQYEGYLYQVEPAFDDISIATVSVIAPVETQGEATATIYGTWHRNLIFLPPECIVSDERGQDAVYVALNGYAVLRNIQTGENHPDKGREILSGLFTDEKVIVSPKNIRTGDRVSE
ncbi:MAG: hypothetical protein IJ367_00080 [Clostridia bacterium]|nr:hypothetical protein [Clostridia bacterium]